ncbi:hypothetical protein LINPERHAP1_LOCUS40618 [Linum perenne]
MLPSHLILSVKSAAGIKGATPATLAATSHSSSQRVALTFPLLLHPQRSQMQ